MSKQQQQQQQPQFASKIFDKDTSGPSSTTPLLRPLPQAPDQTDTPVFRVPSFQSSINNMPGGATVTTTSTSLSGTITTDQADKTFVPLSVGVRSPTSSRPSSRAPSPSISDMSSDDLPTNVNSEEQLAQLPSECLSGDKVRPLQHFDEVGDVSTYALKPMMYSVAFILTVELLERFAFYGLNYTQTSYLTGQYNPDWNAGMESVAASSYVSVSVAVCYTTPFLGAILADSLLGDYYTLIFGSLVFYLPGLFLMAFTTVPGLLGKTFNKSALAFALLFMWPVGTGIVKSVVNVFGAKQFHPLLQSASIEAYYVNFYMAINVGALIGGVAVPVLAQSNVTLAYFLPVTMLSMGIVLFLVGSNRYVCSKPKGNYFNKKDKGLKVSSNTDIPLSYIARVTGLVIPFNIAYSQMGTIFIVQGNVMKTAFGWIDAACMNNVDAVAVLLFGYIIGTHFYPWLTGKGIKIPTTYKFALGSGLGALSIIWALFVERMIHNTFDKTGEQVNVLWQSGSYILIGIGEIFAVSAAYEVAFKASPPDMKVLASAVNLFCIGSLPNVICIALYQLCTPWFMNNQGTTHISNVSEYATAHVDKYFWLLFVISIFGVLINLLPVVRLFVETIEERASDMIRTPKTPMRPPRRESHPDEEMELLKIKRHQYYLKYGSAPQLTRGGSMRAGPTVFKSTGDINKASSKRLKKTIVSKLYKNELPNAPNIFISASGKPVKASNMSPRISRDMSPRISRNKSPRITLDRKSPRLSREFESLIPPVSSNV